LRNLDTCVKMRGMNSIRHYRKLRGLTQVQLAERVGIEQPHLSRLENGDEGPPLSLFRRVAVALDVPLPDLLSIGRAEAELQLVEIFRRLPPDRQAGWLDMARIAALDLPEADLETAQTAGHSSRA
jgi:transcriptional regulator with XRE-family HTH domain